MKKLLSFVCGLLCCAALSAKNPPREAQAYVFVSAGVGEKLECVGSPNGKAEAGEVNRGGTMCPIVRFHYQNKTDGWETASFKFKAHFAGEVSLGLSGLHSFKNGKRRILAVCYDDVKIDGKHVKNGGFENGDFSYNWRINRVYPTRLMDEILPDGKHNKYLRAWALTYATQNIAVEKGKTYEVSFRVKPIGFVDVDTGTQTLDISKYANFKLGDFSNWKMDENLASLDPKQKYFGGMRFRLIDPAANGGMGGVLFNSQRQRETCAKISVPVNYTGAYLYLLHTAIYAQNAPQDIAKITFNTSDGSQRTYIMKRRRDTWIFNDSRDINDNVRTVYTASPKTKRGKVFLSRFELPADAALKSVEIESLNSDALILLGATFSDEKIDTINIKPFNPDEWVAVDMPEDMNMKRGSALDQSAFFDSAPAGAYGRVIVSDRGTLAFEKTPQKDARFKGFSEYSLSYFAKLPADKRAEEIKRYAESFKVYGYNFARISFEILRDNMTDLERQTLYDAADRLVAELKKNGVYIHVTLVWYRMGLKNYNFYIRDDVKLRAVFGDDNVRSHWKKTTEFVLNHVNPYTGLAWKDDPVIVCVEYYNELAICFSRMDETSKFDPNDTILPGTKKLVMSKWHKWLEKRYGEISKLNAAWDKIFYTKGKFNYKTFDEVPCIVKGNDDWTRCCWDHLADFVDFAEKVVDSTGYKGLKVQNNLGPIVYGTAIRSKTTDYVIANTYYSHPSSFNINNAKCPQGDAINERAGFWRGIASMKINNRPMFVTEYNHCYWSKSRYQMPAMFAPYSAFQNFSGLTIHSDAIPHRKPRRTVGPFSVYPSPVAQVSELFCSAMFIRGDVEPARHRIDMKVSDDFLQNNSRSVRGFNSLQTQILLLTGYANAFEGKVPEVLKNVKVKPADMETSPVGSSEIVAEAWFHSVKESGKSDFDLSKFVAEMRRKGILPPENKTDVARGVFQSDTGQITLDAKKIFLKVVTPRSEIIAMRTPETTRLGALKIVSGNVPCTVGICSMDGKKISESSRLIFAFATLEGNTDMKLSTDDVVSVGGGKPPIVVQRGKIEAELRLAYGGKYEVRPVALNGERREKIPFEFADGVMKLKIDNSKLENGATPMFEIVKID